MAISRPFDRHFFVTDVKTSGGSLNLAKGQIAIVDATSGTENGAVVLNSFAGIPKDAKRLQIRSGGNNKNADRSHTDKHMSTKTFSLNEVRKIIASYPERTEQEFDEVVLGYDGFNADSAFSFKRGQAPFRLTLEVSGGSLQYRGGGHADKEVLEFVADIPGCDPFETCEECDECDPVDCRAIVEELVTRMRNREVSGGSKLSEHVDIIPVFSCDVNPEVNTSAVNWYTLTLCDTGDDSALNIVRAQYEFPVIRINRVGSESTYQVMATSAPADFTPQIPSILKGCDACPAEWSTVPGGYVYAITIEDDGTAFTTQITGALANAKFVPGTLVKSGNSAGVGFYTAVYSSPITGAESSTFVNNDSNNRRTATVEFVGEKVAFCTGVGADDIEWVLGDSCESTTRQFSIVIPDTTCGQTRLAELQGMYPSSYNVAIAQIPVGFTQTITITTAGAGTLSIGDDDYSFAAGANPTGTAANIVTALADAEGVTATSTGAVVTLTFPVGAAAIVTGDIVPAEASDLEFTVGASVTVLGNDSRGCQTRYVATVVTNIVCDECDPVFRDFWAAEAPTSFENTPWYLTPGQDAVNPNTNCLCGIRIKGKPFYLSAGEAFRDDVEFEETSTQIRAAAGYPFEIREGIGHIFKGEYSAKYLSRFKPRTHLMGNLRGKEKESRAYFMGEVYRNGALHRVIRGEESAIQDNFTQVAQLSVEIRHEGYAQGLAGRHQDNILYSFHVPFGEHLNLATLLNNLAAAAPNASGGI